MIVTKEHEKKFLIRKACWLIQTQPSGELGMTYTSVHWKEGMEVFETEEECYRALEKVRTKIMDESNCPRCQLKRLTETDRDITGLSPAEKIKGGLAYRCAVCKTLWIKLPHSNDALAYDGQLADYVSEWSARDLKPSTGFKATLNGIQDISDNKHFQLFPAEITLLNGETHPCAEVVLEKRPPPPDWFSKNNWFYMDQVKSIKPSRYAYPHGLAKFINTHNTFVYLKETDTGKRWGFHSAAGIFVPEELVGKSFERITSSDMRDVGGARHYFEPADRGGPDIWTLTPPPKRVWVWGDHG